MIKMRGGFENDVFSGWRKLLCYTKKPGVCKKAKRQYNKRFRKAVEYDLCLSI